MKTGKKLLHLEDLGHQEHHKGVSARHLSHTNVPSGKALYVINVYIFLSNPDVVTLESIQHTDKPDIPN